MSFKEALLEALSYAVSPLAVIILLFLVACIGFAIVVVTESWAGLFVGSIVTGTALLFIIATCIYIGSNDIGILSWERGLG